MTDHEYADLRLHAGLELRRLGLELEADDVVQDACLRWEEAVESVRRPDAQLRWLKTTVSHLVADAGRRWAGERPGDPLERAHLSLDTVWARGGS